MEKVIIAKEELWGEILALIEAMTEERGFGFRFSYDYEDILRERWRYSYSYASFGLFFGFILLLRRVMGSHTLQTVDLDISISSRRGVTAGKLGYLILGVYTDSHQYVSIRVLSGK